MEKVQDYFKVFDKSKDNPMKGKKGQNPPKIFRHITFNNKTIREII